VTVSSPILIHMMQAHKRGHFPGEDNLEDPDRLFHHPFWLQGTTDENPPSPPLSAFLDTFSTPEEEDAYLVPKEYLLGRRTFRFGEFSFFFPSEDWDHMFFSSSDIAQPTDSKCSCFTKAYGTSHVFGSGSFLQTRNFGAPFSFDDPATLLPLGLRFFTPTEIARLHGFPVDDATHPFRFPETLSRVQRYKLLGNSLNCAVVATLLRGLFSGAITRTRGAASPEAPGSGAGAPEDTEDAIDDEDE